MSNYKAILSGQSWNALSSLRISKKPVFLTYTFNGPQWGSSKFDSADKAMARKALKMWGDACGIRFIEVKKADAELKFQWRSDWGDHSARAEFPEVDRDIDEGLVRDFMGGNIYLNTQHRSELSKHKPFKLYILLHEIGHALGLKHPFHKMDHNRQLLKSGLDDVKHTVMSYTGGDINMQSAKLGALDIQAIRALYGKPSQDGKQVAKWSWSKKKQTLTQIGKSKADVVYGVAVKDVVKGRKGNDKIYGFEGKDALYGEAGNDFLSGGDGDDTLHGDVGNDVLRGGYGDDTLQGGAGIDALSGGYGDDMLSGDLDNDVLKGGTGDDILHGGAGDDHLDGENGDDLLSGDSENDTLNGGDGVDTLQGGQGSDVLNGENGDDTLSGDSDNDTLSGGDGKDSLQGGAGSDVLDGGDGDDILHGDFDDDVLKGGEGDDLLQGGVGKDDLDGGDGYNTLSGDSGNDTLSGGHDRDTLQGGAGSDILTGGGDSDLFVFDTPFNGVDDIDQITDFQFGYNRDRIALSSTVFGNLAKGELLWTAFAEGPVAADADDRILFDRDERSLSYDPDGSGPAPAICFVKFTARVSIHYDDFRIV
ncbi:matrixin family metalloprotease [Microvirga lenta]|uniref:matrixin family metalloprotease n=1 Tax=Microvirga lenta TaxID=2881337 RepID=UPI001CFFE327|nr:matrixin family metalloprotease [Microvirga lenta]MCB5175947.1 matrixin family metalloprotease [Microvirga lenta]